MSNEKTPAFVIMKDHTSECYVIPAHLSNEFNELEAKNDRREFIVKFGIYITDGWLNAEAIADYLNQCNYHGARTAPKKPSALEMVEEFHQAFNCPVLKTPIIPDVPFGYALVMDHIEAIKDSFKKSTDKSRAFLRIKLVFEEFTELAEAISTHNMVEILDALCDLLYVVYGTAHEFGLGPVLKEAFREVHRSNMSKLNGDGTPIVRNDGKVLKGPNFTPPDLAGIIDKFNSLASIHPDWDTKKWREACDKAIKEGPGMPEPKNDGVIYADLKKGTDTQAMKADEEFKEQMNHEKIKGGGIGDDIVYGGI